MSKRVENYWSKVSGESKITNITIGDIRVNRRLRTLSWTEDQKTLCDEINNGKYDHTNQDSPISVSGDNICLNGHHRLHCLLEYYDDDYVVKVHKLNSKYWYILFMVTITLIFKPSLLMGE